MVAGNVSVKKSVHEVVDSDEAPVGDDSCGSVVDALDGEAEFDAGEALVGPGNKPLNSPPEDEVNESGNELDRFCVGIAKN